MNQDFRRSKHLWKLSRLVSSQNAINLFNTFLGKFPQFYFCEELIQINFTIKQLNIYVLEAKILWGKNIFWSLSTSFAPNRSSLQGNANKMMNQREDEVSVAVSKKDS